MQYILTCEEIAFVMKKCRIKDLPGVDYSSSFNKDDCIASLSAKGYYNADRNDLTGEFRHIMDEWSNVTDTLIRDDLERDDYVEAIMKSEEYIFCFKMEDTTLSLFVIPFSDDEWVVTVAGYLDLHDTPSDVDSFTHIISEEVYDDYFDPDKYTIDQCADKLDIATRDMTRFIDLSLCAHRIAFTAQDIKAKLGYVGMAKYYNDNGKEVLCVIVHIVNLAKPKKNAYILARNSTEKICRMFCDERR